MPTRGAIIGGFVMRGLGFSAQGGSFYAILAVTIGAVLLTFLVRVFLGRKSRHDYPSASYARFCRPFFAN